MAAAGNTIKVWHLVVTQESLACKPAIVHSPLTSVVCVLRRLKLYGPPGSVVRRLPAHPRHSRQIKQVASLATPRRLSDAGDIHAQTFDGHLLRQLQHSEVVPDGNTPCPGAKGCAMTPLTPRASSNASIPACKIKADG